ncbi:MAG: NTP transferase domain-containing protein [Candidatus Schekmanbacteria bacterium]|nr:NTP transferase domain-containing protein [Candidatus Schekmanbacteria bacterium]
MKAVILAGGRGSNLNPITETRAKSMINICGKPILEYIIRGLKDAGVSDCIMVVDHQKEMIKNHFGRGEKWGMSLSYAEQDKKKGIGGAVLSASDRFSEGGYFLLVYGDIVFSSNIFLPTLMSFNSLKAAVATICIPPAPGEYGNIYMNDEVQITRIIEKPDHDRLGNYILAGVFVLPVSFFDILKDVGGKMEDAFEKLLQNNGLHASIYEDDWIDIGYPWNIIDANKICMKEIDKTVISNTAKFENNVTINGPVVIEDGVVVKAGATINGPCYVGKNSFVGNNALIREYTSLGAESLVGFGVEIKNSIIFERANIGRLSFIGDSVVGEGVDISPCVVTVNRDINRETINTMIKGKKVDSKLQKLGAFIGDGAIIGASNTILPGTIIPHNAKVPHKSSLSNSDF